MKTLFWDVETTDLELAIRTYQLKNRISYFNHKDIKRDWTMLGAAWKFQGDKNPTAISVSSRNPLDDELVIRHLHDVLSEADTIIGHNSDNFDIKKFNTRAIQYGLSPLSPKTQIDTLKIARKYFKFTSNTLSYICNYLGIHAKNESPDWDACINGCPDNLRYMREYNKDDVICTEQLYDKLMAWHHTHPNVSEPVRDIEGNTMPTCKKCGSANLKKNGTNMLHSGRKRQKLTCLDCGGHQIGGLI